MLYNETDLENSMSKIDTINFHQEIEIDGIKFWCYHGWSYYSLFHSIELLKTPFVYFYLSWSRFRRCYVYD